VRFLHTSDWHLGRRLGEHDRLADQAHALDQLVRMAREERVDAILVAGDLFDRAVPPPETVELLSAFLAQVGLPVVLISGNHDSPARLGFGAELIATAGVHLRTRLASRLVPVVVADTAIFTVPYLDPDHVRVELADPGVTSQASALSAALAAVHAARDRHAGPAVLMAHLFVGGGLECQDSERPLAVGGAGQVAAESLEGFDYVALGHLHAPQEVGHRAVRYSGSLLKYSFAEAEQAKGVVLVEVARHQRPHIELLPLTPLRDVTRLEASFDELLGSPAFAVAETAYVEATYTDAGYVVDAAARLRARYPFLAAARPRRLLSALSTAAPAARALATSDDLALFRAFWDFVGEGEPSLEHERAFLAAIGEQQGPVLEVVP
jgi:exonuclease SbcD